MTKILKKLILPGLVIGLIATFAFIGTSVKTSQNVGAQQGNILKMNISKGVSVTTSTTNLLPASSGRQYVVFVNDGSNPVYLSLTGSAAVANAGIRLNADGGSYEMNSLNQTSAAINAIATGGTSNVTVTASQ